MEYKKLKEIVEKNKMKFFEDRPNFIWVRKDLIADNHFTDDLLVAYKGQVVEIKATTIPGTKKSLFNPVTVDGVTGTAIIKKGQYIDAWEFRDTTTEFTNYPYFRQIKPIDYYRDGNKDAVINLVQEQKNKLYRTHWHVMSNEGDKRKIEEFEVNNWSLGCMGSVRSEWDKVIALMRSAIKNGCSTKVTGTILDSVDLLIK